MLLLLHGPSKAMPSPVRWLYCLTLKGLCEIQIFKKYSRIIFWFHQNPKFFSHSIKHCTVISKGLPILCLILLKTLVCEQKVRPPSYTHPNKPFCNDFLSPADSHLFGLFFHSSFQSLPGYFLGARICA